MQYTLAFVAALAGVVTAQQIDIAAINAAPAPAVTAAPVGVAGQGQLAYNSDAAAAAAASDAQPAKAAKVKRGDCAVQPDGTGPAVRNPDTAEAFQKSPYFAFQANAQPFPYNPFPYVEKFRNLNGSTQQNSYLTYYVLDSYNPRTCAAYCDKVDLCTAFNIYFERDPSVDPGTACPNPPSITNIKCTLWGSSISRETATNTGQYREQFHVVVAGSNGYDKTPSFSPAISVPQFDRTANISGSTISVSPQKGVYFTADFFSGPFDPSVCGVYAQAQTKANRDAAIARGLSSYQPCNFFGAYTPYKNKYAQGTMCALYTTPIDASNAKKAAINSGNDFFDVGASWTYTLTKQDSGKL
ncbi:uncharacterized protein RCC_06526 [Ramularia collo-cygni]|uniref:Apple domain-containing protein n=1 Tax=Ramularia collo-cygni TaxID=112498 RepID=A0A2D3UYX2_9PEZI|nr:uncharacterized protein RCC_06526 [Ramularia collo-cygni]CZT20668.1 uncharacterized protein RCC_06526 [Ramularia collo-cygni]